MWWDCVRAGRTANSLRYAFYVEHCKFRGGFSYLERGVDQMWTRYSCDQNFVYAVSEVQYQRAVLLTYNVCQNIYTAVQIHFVISRMRIEIGFFDYFRLLVFVHWDCACNDYYDAVPSLKRWYCSFDYRDFAFEFSFSLILWSDYLVNRITFSIFCNWSNIWSLAW